MAALDLPATLGERLRQRRRELGLSLRALSDTCGVAASTISRIENGVFTPTWNTAVRLAQSLRLELSNSRVGLAAEPAESAETADRAGGRREDGGALSLQKATSPVAVRLQVLTPGVRKDLRRVASGRPYRFLTVLNGEVLIRARDGSRLSLRPGLRLDCDLLRKNTFFAVSAQQAELLWIG